MTWARMEARKRTPYAGVARLLSADPISVLAAVVFFRNVPAQVSQPTATVQKNAPLAVFFPQKYNGLTFLHRNFCHEDWPVLKIMIAHLAALSFPIHFFRVGV